MLRHVHVAVQWRRTLTLRRPQRRAPGGLVGAVHLLPLCVLLLLLLLLVVVVVVLLLLQLHGHGDTCGAPARDRLQLLRRPEDKARC
jgi:hypothetical protein